MDIKIYKLTAHPTDQSVKSLTWSFINIEEKACDDIKLSGARVTKSKKRRMLRQKGT